MLILAACTAPSKDAHTGSPHSGGPHTGTEDTGEPPPASLGALTLRTDPRVSTMLNATWAGEEGRESWVEYRFGDDSWRTAPALAAGQAVLLGIPADTEVEARAVARYGETDVYSDAAFATTGGLPAGLLPPTLGHHDATLAYEAEYVMVSVATGEYTFEPPYYIEILDRQGRVVWWRETTDDLFTFYPTVARDGTHLWFDGSNIFDTGSAPAHVTRTTLDSRQVLHQVVPDMGQAIDEGPDGSWFHEQRGGGGYRVNRLDPDGTSTVVWDCEAWMRGQNLHPAYCYLNATNWDPDRDTVLASGFYANTVFEIDVATGALVRQMGQFTVGEPYAFDPPASMFDYQHYPRWLANGNLLVSTHEVDRSGVQIAAEYEVDDAAKLLRRVWSYTSKDRWATQVGEAVRLPNGNTVQGYGQDGAVREVTPEGETAWEVYWPKDKGGYRVVGHATMIPDLYALNRGWE